MKLSKRLQTVASFVQKGSNVADIGTDHGYIPIYLVQEGIAGRALAMDVRKGPLERARDHIRESGLEDRIETRLSDGLAALKPGEADTVVIAGMGGELIIHIMEAGDRVRKSVKRWVLSPQSDLDKVRHYLETVGLAIDEEAMIQEEGKYYTVMSVSPGESRMEKEYDYKYGRQLIRSGSPVLAEYLKQERKKLEEIERKLQFQDGGKALERRAEILRELEQIKEVQNEMQRAD